MKKALQEEKAYNKKVTEQNKDVYQNVETPSYNDQKVYTDIEQVSFNLIKHQNRCTVAAVYLDQALKAKGQESIFLRIDFEWATFM